MHCSYVFAYNYTSIHVANISEIANVFPPSSQHRVHAVKKPGDRGKEPSPEPTFFITLSLSGAWSNRVSKASRSAWTGEGEETQGGVHGNARAAHPRGLSPASEPASRGCPAPLTLSHPPRIPLIPTRARGQAQMRDKIKEKMLPLSHFLSCNMELTGGT